MKIIENKKFQKAIEENLNKIPKEAKKDFVRVNELFSKQDINIIGGFVRDSILNILYKYNFPINDLDILIEDLDFEYKIKNFPRNKLSRFGGLKFNYNKFSIDLFSLNNIFFLKNNPKFKKNLENVLKGCDLSTSALGYNLNSGKIYSLKAIEDIYKKEINVNNHAYMESAPTISRLILHSDKMGFKIGKSGIDYIRENYSPELDEKIRDFLNYKKIKHLFPLIENNINKIIQKLPQQDSY